MRMREFFLPPTRLIKELRFVIVSKGYFYIPNAYYETDLNPQYYRSKVFANMNAPLSFPIHGKYCVTLHKINQFAIRWLKLDTWYQYAYPLLPYVRYIRNDYQGSNWVYDTQAPYHWALPLRYPDQTHPYILSGKYIAPGFRSFGSNIAFAELLVYGRFMFEGNEPVDGYLVYWLFQDAHPDSIVVDLNEYNPNIKHPFFGDMLIGLCETDISDYGTFKRMRRDDFNSLLLYQPDKPDLFTPLFMNTNEKVVFTYDSIRDLGVTPMFCPRQTAFAVKVIHHNNPHYHDELTYFAVPIFRMFLPKATHPMLEFTSSWEIRELQESDLKPSRPNYKFLPNPTLPPDNDDNPIPPEMLDEGNFDFWKALRQFVGTKGIVITTNISRIQKTAEYFYAYEYMPGRWELGGLVRNYEVFDDSGNRVFKWFLPYNGVLFRTPIVYNKAILSDLGGFVHFSVPPDFNFHYRILSYNQPQYHHETLLSYYWGHVPYQSPLDLKTKPQVLNRKGQNEFRLLWAFSSQWKEVDYDAGARIVKTLFRVGDDD